MRKPMIVGNWKMYKTPQETKDFFDILKPLVATSTNGVFLAVPFVDILTASEMCHGSHIRIGAQNVSEYTSGAYTGEVSAQMICCSGASFTLVGHSERRMLFHEKDDSINKKLKTALQQKLQVILCFGETEQDKEAGRTFKVIENQILQGLEGIEQTDFSHIVLAYEPVWAIGTGKSATPKMAQEVHSMTRNLIASHWKGEVAQNVSILYGGSVKPDNISDLMLENDIDGVLVGGASLDPKVFSQLVNFK
jgi:triosephosphate isomerase